MARKYRVNADSWTVLEDILTGSPETFNLEKSATLWGLELIGENPTFGTGRLPQEYVNMIEDHVVRYVIYSYQTPIAWRQVAEWDTDGAPIYEWIVPNVRYSVTTSKHQGRVRTALHNQNYGE